MSLSDVAENLHIRSTYLQAIEEEEWAVIGAPVYIRGFIRTYARFLGVDPEHAIEGFNATEPAAPPTKQWNGGGAVNAGPERRQAFTLALACRRRCASGSSGTSATATTNCARAPEKTAAAIPVAQTSATPAESLPPASATPLEAAAPPVRPVQNVLSVKLTQLSWMRVIVDGNVVLKASFRPGPCAIFTAST